MLTSLVENFPGFEDGIEGPKLVKKMKLQAEKFGTTVEQLQATKVDLMGDKKVIWSGDTEFSARAVIIAVGSKVKWLGIHNEEKFIGKGVSSCATCDGYFFTGKDVAVVGGGDSAMEEALFLSRLANSVTIIVRGDKLRASKIMQDRVKADPKVKIIWKAQITELTGDEFLTGVKLDNGQELTISGLFIAIGHAPDTDIFRDQVELDQEYVKSPTTNTNLKGVFVAGDVHDQHYRQAVTAAGDGCKAAMDAERYLATQV